MAKSIAIIGGGIAGLATGCYGRMNGFETCIFEMHDKPGGLCTSWKIGGYTFDGCIHWLVGTKPGGNFNQIWAELGALQARKIVDHDEFTRVEGPGGKPLIIYTDLDRLKSHLIGISPEDSRVINQLIRSIKRFRKMEVPIDQPGPLSGMLLLLKMVPIIPLYRKWSRVSAQDFARTFHSPFLREVFPLLFDLVNFPMLGIIGTLGWLSDNNAGYPTGGSLEMSKAIERRYLDLGGKVSYKSRVEKILVENDRAVGVKLADGTEHRADIVVSAADGHATIFDMLDAAFIDDTIRGYYDELPVFHPIVIVSLGIARDLSSEPHSASFPLEEPVTIAGQSFSRLNYKHYCYDPTMAPPGKSTLISIIPTEYGYWKSLSLDKARYKEEKKRIAGTVIGELNKRFPGIQDDIEVVDVATPVTLERYTGNWKASFEGWLLTMDTGKFMIKPMKNTLPGLKDFYMAGQWVKPGGGLPSSAQSGREVIQAICKTDNRVFTASRPSMVSRAGKEELQDPEIVKTQS